MKTAVIVFPGSNCDRDAAMAIEAVTGAKPAMVWHEETELPEGLDFVMVPGGFSYGDYLRSGAVAARSPIIADLKKKAEAGVPMLGVCNGFQILTEAGLLDGTLMRNASLHFVCEKATLYVETANTRFTRGYGERKEIVIPIAHHDGNYFADDETLNRLEDNGQVAFRYANNPNGSARDIAGVTNAAGNVLGMMPHPERAVDEKHGGTDGVALFESVLGKLS
jgi:phosphoribosylformylglycinamidine synthase I